MLEEYIGREVKSLCVDFIDGFVKQNGFFWSGLICDGFSFLLLKRKTKDAESTLIFEMSFEYNGEGYEITDITFESCITSHEPEGIDISDQEYENAKVITRRFMREWYDKAQTNEHNQATR